MTEYSLYPVLQLAYRKGNSTETALLKVKNDILPTLSSHDRDGNGDAKAEKGLGRDRGCGGKL